jgi:predicted Zn-dependent protease
VTALRRVGGWVLGFGLLAACGTVPYTERNQLMAISKAEEATLGEAAFLEVKNGSRLVDDSRLRLVVGVGERIAATVGGDGYRWEFILVENDEPNAFALPGGKVAFHTGILPYCENEDGVAAVMAHEVAHVLARHGAERLSQGRLLEFGGAAVSAVFSGGSPALQRGVRGAYGMGGKVGVLLPFSRQHESEADEIGLVLMAKAGFDPREAPRFWRRLLAGGKGGERSEILSTHPGDEKRIGKLEELMPVAVEYYRKAVPSQRRPKDEDARPPDISPEDILRRLREPEPPG